jgi:hypothetical protein
MPFSYIYASLTLNAQRGFLSLGVFAFKNIFQKLLRKFGSFAILTVLVAKGETTTRLCGRERG